MIVAYLALLTMAAAPSVAAAAAGVAPPAISEGPPTVELGLAEAQAEARSRSADAAELGARVAATKRSVEPGRRIFRSDPVLQATVESGAPFGQLEEGAVNAGVSWTVDPSGSWGPRQDAADAEVARAELERVDGLLALDEAVATAVADLARAQRRAKRAQRIAGLRARLSAAAHAQLDVGQGNQLDVDAADLEFAGARATLATSQASIETARARLTRLLGRATGDGLVVADPPEPPAEVASASFGQALDAAVERNVRVRAARADLEAARKGEESESRLAWPQPTLGLAYTFQQSEIPAGAFASNPDLSPAVWADHELGISVSVPLPLFNANAEARAKSAARVLAAEARLRVVETEVAAGLSANLAELRGALAAFAALAGTPEILERAYQLQDEAVRAGVGDVVSRSLAFARLESAGERLDDAIFDVRVARARWTRAASAGERAGAQS